MCKVYVSRNRRNLRFQRRSRCPKFGDTRIVPGTDICTNRLIGVEAVSVDLDVLDEGMPKFL